jgi:hypothetical protein
MKSQRMKKLLRWVVRIFVALPLLVALFIIEENLRGRILLVHYKTELRSKGERLTLAEFNFPKPTESADYHVLMISAGELTNLGQAFATGALEFSCRPRFIGPGCCMVRRLQPDTDLRFRDTAWEVASLGEKRNPTAAYYVATWEELAERVAFARQPLDAIRATLQKPVLAMSVEYAGDQIGVPQYRAAAAVDTWSSVAALSDLHQNDLDAALEDLLISTELMRSLRDSQSYELQMRRLYTGEAALDVTWEALQTPGWNDAQLARLQTAWEEVSVIKDYELAAEVERAIILQRWDGVVNKPMRELLGWSETEPSDVSKLLGGMVWYAGWRQQDQARGVWLWAEGVDAVRTSLSASKWIVARDAFQKVQQDEWNPRWPRFDQWRYQMSIPDPSGWTWGPGNLFYDVKRLLEYETRREMTIAAIALKRFELRHGKLAPDLAALVPEFLDGIPHDYMDGGSLRYRLKWGNDWVLYSVGENSVDEGGDPISSEPRGIYFSIWDGRDAVWPAAATREEVEAWEARRRRHRDTAADHRAETTLSSTNASSTVVQGHNSTR